LIQYIPGLRENGIELTEQHLLGDAYQQRRVFGNWAVPWSDIVGDGWARIRCLLASSSYDAIMLHCELFPLLPAWIERLLMRRPYIYDFDDAFYLKYRRGRWRALGGVLASKFDSVMRGATVVTAGSRVLAEYALERNPNTVLLPTAVDVARYNRAPKVRGKEFVVGWIGSPSTAPYLKDMVAPLMELAMQGPVRFIVVGGPAPSIPGVLIEERAWNEMNEVDAIAAFDVGVMPLPDEAWARGKCAYKLIQYMACGVPAIASPVGANVDVLDGGCGFLARSETEWTTCLRRIRDCPVEARHIGDLGRARVAERYSLQGNLPELVQIIQSSLQG
jgi:glycosyltransferase involved in cell wall biosynthesis